MNDFNTEFKFDTLDEIEDHLSKMGDILAKSRNDIESVDVDELFRIFHSIKGNARAAEFIKLSEVSHNFESSLIYARDNHSFSQDTVELVGVFQAKIVEAIEKWRENIDEDISFESVDLELEKYQTKALESDSIQQINCLIVEDEVDILDILSTNIQDSFGYSVSEATNGSEGFDISKSKHFDFIITDFKMPIMDGGEFIRKVREESGPNQQTPIILLTAYRPNLEADQGIWEKVFFLEKPCSEKNLEFIIRCCMNFERKTAA